LEFNLVDLKITIQTNDPLRFCLCIADLGAEFATICKRLACRGGVTACNKCPVRADCAWYAVFSQELSADPDAIKRHQKPPLPFVFSFPSPDTLDHEPDIIECGLVVVGIAIPHASMLLEGLAKLLVDESSPLEGEIRQLACRDYQGTYVPLRSGTHSAQAENLVVLSAEGLPEPCSWDCSSLGIRLLSPLKLIREGRQLSRFDFSLFACTLMRRVSSLAYYYGDSEFDCDYKRLASLALAVVCTEDRFHIHNAGNGDRKLAGISGEGFFSGDFSELMPFLTLGTYLHAGKGAAYGMGRFMLSGCHSGGNRN
jgi:hypothetical protein